MKNESCFEIINKRVNELYEILKNSKISGKIGKLYLS